MDQTLGLLGSGGGGGGGPGGGAVAGGGGGGLSDESVSTKLERNYMGISSEGSSSYENEAEIELGLGLSLNSSKRHCSDNNVRILTAKDLPNGLFGTKRAAADSVSRPAENANSSTGISQVVGWPPLRAYRINSLVNQSKMNNNGGNEKKENLKKKTNYGNQKKKNDEDGTKEKGGYLGFIKVNVDGIPIGRKVDLSAHTCYESLAESLADMFFNSIPTIGGGKEQSRQTLNLLDESSEFVLTYEDKEGDWMLVGDVPWRMFLCTAKRLRIMRNSESNGISPNIPKKA
ncbi:OLC1v1019521C1 [Oldenlandia corymbosa var. corymbosa]|uniref:Auxin-responsive protein n=1 Tax=Oldenlandia corymbosa var. corymbosa TaxID=529605 RepID=A0AAV1EE59_OLDCO|nr:OLC1v1019521C1 [Oldenlandia corymbosa var. corymbosa]